MRGWITYAVLRGLFLGVLIALSGATIASPAVAQDAQPILGTTLSAIPPKGFRPASDFPGFIFEAIGGTIVVTEVPKGAFGEYSALFSDTKKLNRKFARAGMQMSKITPLTTSDGQKVNLAQGIHVALNGKFDMWTAVYSGDRTSLVTLKAAKKGALKTSEIVSFFQSVKPGRTVSESESLSLLPYNLTVIEPFRMVGTPTAMSTLLTVGPDDLNSRNSQPTILVIYGRREPLLGDLDRAAEIQLRSTSSFRDSEIRRRTAVRFAGSDGILFEGVSTVKGKTIEFSQRFAAGPANHFIRLVAAGEKAQMQELEAVVAQISSSVVFKKNN